MKGDYNIVLVYIFEKFPGTYRLILNIVAVYIKNHGMVKIYYIIK